MSLDINKHYKKIQSIVEAKASSHQSDTEDLIQDVCLKICRMNRGSNPFDPDKSSVETYINMVSSSVLTDAYRKNKRTPLKKINENEEPEKIDWSSPDLDGFYEYLIKETDYEDIFPRRMYRLLRMGYTHKEIENFTEVSGYQINKTKKFLKALARGFI